MFSPNDPSQNCYRRWPLSLSEAPPAVEWFRAPARLFCEHDTTLKFGQFCAPEITNPLQQRPRNRSNCPKRQDARANSKSSVIDADSSVRSTAIGGRARWTELTYLDPPSPTTELQLAFGFKSVVSALSVTRILTVRWPKTTRDAISRQIHVSLRFVGSRQFGPRFSGNSCNSTRTCRSSTARRRNRLSPSNHVYDVPFAPQCIPRRSGRPPRSSAPRKREAQGNPLAVRLGLGASHEIPSGPLKSRFGQLPVKPGHHPVPLQLRRDGRDPRSPLLLRRHCPA